MKRRLIGAALVGRKKFMSSSLAFCERYIGMREANANQERYHACDGFEFSDFDIVLGCACPRRDEKLFHAIITDSTHDPDAVIARAFLVRSFLTQDFGVVAAFHEFAESTTALT